MTPAQFEFLKSRFEENERRLDYRAAVMPTIFCNAFNSKEGNNIEIHTFFPALAQVAARSKPIATPEELKAKLKAAFPPRTEVPN